ncbi:MAG: hypothetical protein JW763_11035 [candidate division Zixibacteria bacterium]|nr:hypothetical protein [candidate division Zixibacteria bacterium]
MVRILHNKVEVSARGLMITACLLSMLLFGSALDIVVRVTADQSSDESTHSYQVLAEIRIPTDHGEMAGHSSASTEKAFYITIPATLGNGGVDNHKPILKAIPHRITTRAASRPVVELIAAAEISSHKTREFTLVGAKPSGTS